MAALKGAALVFAAGGCPGADAAHAALARAAGVVLNTVDMPDLCDAYTPSLVDRDPVVVAIGTEGTAPVLGRQIKTQIEGMLEPELGRLARIAGGLRDAVAARVPMAARRGFWRWVFAETPRRMMADGRLCAAEAAIKAAIEAGAAPEEKTGGHVALVGAGPGAADLITLRGVKRLQEADVILHDRLVSDEELELARRDAERIYVGKAPGDACLPEKWSQERINRLMLRLAQEGKAVVRLKSGDPGVFGRAEEELAACRAAGIPCEIVPGITAASGAFAAAGQTLTERGEVETLVLATGTNSRHAVPEGLGRQLRPGARLAIYMGTGQAGPIEDDLRAEAPGDLTVEIIERATRRDASHHTCRLDALEETVAMRGISAPAMIFVTYPKSRAAGAGALPE
ncbi:MAG: siroheme synthase CysG, partial [Pseudomonadota bacterium]